MISINVCIGSACHLKGSRQVIQGLQKLIKDHQLEEKVELKAAFCLGHCTDAVSVQVNDDAIISVNEQNVDIFFYEYILGKV